MLSASGRNVDTRRQFLRTQIKRGSHNRRRWPPPGRGCRDPGRGSGGVPTRPHQTCGCFLVLVWPRLRIVPIFPQGQLSERYARAHENLPTRKRRDAVVLFSRGVIFMLARVSPAYPWGKLGTTRSLFDPESFASIGSYITIQLCFYFFYWNTRSTITFETYLRNM